VTLTFGISSQFDEQTLLKYMTNTQSRRPRTEYEKHRWSINGLTIVQYEKKLVAQGILNDLTKSFLKGLAEVKGLTLDEKNMETLLRIFPTKHNAVLCTECRGTCLLIEGRIEGLDIVFKGECGHKNDLRPPIFVLNNRVLPDINILIARTMSRLIDLGCFDGFKVVVPDFILDVVDKFKGSHNKDAVSDELAKLRQLQDNGKITIDSLSSLPVKIAWSDTDEDKVILGLASLTNSLLLTSDPILKERAMMQERPTVYLPADTFGNIKMIHETRKLGSNPE